MNKSEILKKKLLYRSSYRGTKEMDILLSSFVKFYIDKFTEEELKDLNKFLILKMRLFLTSTKIIFPTILLKEIKFLHI